ncbi:hypothetical protein BHE74_00035363, partial [Ensete ventricosum]
GRYTLSAASLLAAQRTFLGPWRAALPRNISSYLPGRGTADALCYSLSARRYTLLVRQRLTLRGDKLFE